MAYKNTLLAVPRYFYLVLMNLPFFCVLFKKKLSKEHKADYEALKWSLDCSKYHKCKFIESLFSGLVPKYTAIVSAKIVEIENNVNRKHSSSDKKNLIL